MSNVCSSTGSEFFFRPEDEGWLAHYRAAFERTMQYGDALISVTILLAQEDRELRLVRL